MVKYFGVLQRCLELATTTTLEGLVLLGISPAFNNQKYYNTFINTSANNFNININSNTSEFEKGYQYQYQYLRIPNSIPIPIPIPKFSNFNINIKTIPKYLDTLRSQDNIKKDRAGIAHL